MSKFALLASLVTVGGLAAAYTVMVPEGGPGSPGATSPVANSATGRDADLAYQISAEPLELTIHLHFRNQDVWNTDWPTNREAARLTNVSLRGVASMATTSSHEAFNLMMASGDLPDIVAGNEVSHSLKPKFIQYGMEGAFLPLDPLIERHAPHLKKFIAEHPRIMNSVRAPDGFLYFIPHVPEGEFGCGWFIRKDWLDKLGLKMPDTVDELYEVGKAFRDRDPNGNGKRDEVFFFARRRDQVFRLLVPFGSRSTGSDTPHDFFVDGGVVQHPYAVPEYRPAMRTFAQWYAEGLIDQEFYTRDRKSRDYMLGNDLGGMSYDWFGSTATYNDRLAEKYPGFEFVAFPPPADAKGKRINEHRRTAVKPSGWAITSTSRHAVEAIQYFDFVFSEAGIRLFNFGVEGVHYDRVDGKPVFKDHILNNGRPVNSQMWDIGAQVPIGFLMDYSYEPQWLNQTALDGIELYRRGNWQIEEFLGVAFSKEERRLYDRHWPSILSYMLEMQQGWALGTRDVDADWEGYQERLSELGLPTVMSILQKAHDRQ